jgi:glycine dehydrogenase
VLYTGRDGRVAHECILDIRPLKEADRHQRAGYCQAPDRLRFPRADHVVPGCGYADGGANGIESKAELDRFIDAMLAIRMEIDRVQDGEWTLEDNPLVNAAHPERAGGEWNHGYPASWRLPGRRGEQILADGEAS